MTKTIKRYFHQTFRDFHSISLSFRFGMALGAGLFLLLSSFTWRSYLSYSTPQQIVQADGGLIYVLASNGLYTYNTKDQSVRTFDKVNGLSDCNISHIAYNKVSHRLLIVYANQNIDLMDRSGEVTNLSAYHNTTMTADKTVNSIYLSGRYAYLATGFGIVKLNTAAVEVSDTYNLGFSVDYVHIRNNALFAASAKQGVYSAQLTANLADRNNWHRVGNYVGPTPEDQSALWAKVANANPGGPRYNHFGFMRFHKGKLYTCGGYGAPFRPGTIQVLVGNTWQIYEDAAQIQPKTGLSYQDIYCIDIDPKDENHLFAGARNGLYEFQDGHFKAFYNHRNAPIGFSTNDKSKEYELVTGLKFDANASLWLFNSQSQTASLLQYSDQKWTTHTAPALMSFNGRSLANAEKLMFDSRGRLWFVNNNWTLASLYSYQPESKTLHAFTSFTNEDGTTLKELWNVRSVVEDKEGNIWIGTNVGPLMLPPNQFDSNSPVFQQIKVPRNDGTGYADYLLSGVDITAMAIDGANRKWFATNGNGVYLVSSNNIEELHHFTAENSPLLSNAIESISINDVTGEVFFGTDQGLCSCRADATEAQEEMTEASVYAYPNPVRPDYTGPIHVTGLTYNADVKITTSNGTLVKEGRSNGGLFTWDGCDKQGKRVASGIYMVETATQDGKKGVVCKIAILN